MPLDLAFRPAPERDGARLSAADLSRYNHEGWIGPLDVFGPAEVRANRAGFDRLLGQAGGAYAINCYQTRARTIWDLCTDARIVDLVADVIGPDVACWASHFFCKLPGDPRPVPWHQDATYWHLSPARTVTVWLAIDDADAGNGAMRFVPGTHAMGPLPSRAAAADAVLDRETDGADAMGAPAVDALRAGQCSLHADMLVHGLRPNLGDRCRCGLTIRDCPPEVRITDPGWARGIEAIACRGDGGDWRHHPRPEGDDVSPGNSPRNVGGN